jgi:hypothetical protein
MSDTIEYRPFLIDIDDFLRLKAAVGDRDRNLRLILGHTDAGDEYISATIKGSRSEPLFTVRHAEAETGKPCWLVHHPSDGPMYEFAAPSEVAAFLASGDARLCKRSWLTARSAPGLIVAGELPAETPKWASEAAPGRRGRALPMLGDRAGE